MKMADEHGTSPGVYVQFWFWRLPLRRSSKSPNAKPERERWTRMRKS